LIINAVSPIWPDKTIFVSILFHAVWNIHTS